MRDLKYLLAYLLPVSGIVAIYFGGIWSFSTFFFAYIMIPTLELLMPGTTSNFEEAEEEERLKSGFFDVLLWLNVPLLYFILGYYFYTISMGELLIYELLGMTIGVGMICGALGINVAHELGHRTTWHDRVMSKTLLLSCFYMHFSIEHNLGHHKHVATDEDPASSRLGETVYAFFIRSVRDSYLSAWKIEHTRLRRTGLKIVSIQNEMIRFQVIQLLYFMAIGLIFGWIPALFAVVVGIMGFLMLETINYVEHYGLRRKKLASGRYEKVQPHHSWNSNHTIGRILLYELTRHSDHHFKANRKYQILRHFDETPQMPYGYPASMLMAWLPPLWFRVMNKEVVRYSNV